MARFRRRSDPSFKEFLDTPVAGRAFEEEILLGRVREKIAQLLEKESLQQQDLAERLGVSRGRVSQFLSGAENMTLKTLAGIGFALGYRFDFLPESIQSGDHLRDIDDDETMTGIVPAREEDLQRVWGELERDFDAAKMHTVVVKQTK